MFKSTTKIHAVLSKEDDISLGRTCKMVPARWGRVSRGPEKREINKRGGCAEALGYI